MAQLFLVAAVGNKVGIGQLRRLVARHDRVKIGPHLEQALEIFILLKQRIIHAQAARHDNFHLQRNRFRVQRFGQNLPIVHHRASLDRDFFSLDGPL